MTNFSWDSKPDNPSKSLFRNFDPKTVLSVSYMGKRNRGTRRTKKRKKITKRNVAVTLLEIHTPKLE